MRVSKTICIQFLFGYSSVISSQCLKRKLKCEYPSESHRGVRRKKQKNSLELNAMIMTAAGLNDPDTDAEGEDEDNE